LGLLIVVTVRLASAHARKPHGAHQPLHRASGNLDTITPHLVPDFAGTIEAKAVLVDAFDDLLDLVVAPSTRRTSAGIGKASGMFVIGGRGDRQFAADRLDTQFLAMRIDERHHHLPWR
jgi:hypothetical protein